MENASKALIIVASVIISMVIVGLGVYFVGIAQSNQNSADGIKDVEIKTANAKFDQYFGDHVDAAKVKMLIKDVQLNNNRNVAQDIDNKNITIFYNGSNGTNFVNDEDKISSNIKTGRYYKVGVITNKFDDKADKAGYYKAGYLKGINIEYKNDNK